MNDLLQLIEKVFKEKKLIGNYDFTEDEYSLMIDSLSTLYDNFDKNFYKLIFATLVEIAKRWKQSDTTENDEEHSGYWNFVFKTLFSLSNIDQQLCQKYRNVIYWLGRNANLPVVESGQHYYATIMMHSFAPKSSIYSFFDLCYNVFKKDLNFGFTTDDEYICEKVATEIVNVLGLGYSEDKEVSIGSSAYSIKIGLRSFALNIDLHEDFIEFIRDTFYQINKLFDREKIPEVTRLQRYLIEWWKNKTEAEKQIGKNGIIRVSTVSKQNISAKYIRNDKEVFLCIPPIRLDDISDSMRLLMYVDGVKVFSEEMKTKRGELVTATKQEVFELNNLLKQHDSIKLMVKIKEEDKIIFNSESKKTTSLNREFILFDDEKEVLSHLNKPSNYFVYSKDIDALESKPKELTTYSPNLYNIYPKAGESLIGKTKQVFFVNKEKEARLGINACLIGDFADVEWLFDDISYAVYISSVKLIIPKNYNLKALEIRIDSKSYKLSKLKYEQLGDNYYQFGIKSLGLIFASEPYEISLFSFESEKILFTENLIVLPDLDIQFNKPFYYGDIERKVTVTTEKGSKKLSWTNHEKEIKYPYNDGILLIKIPYLRWRINLREWYNKSINNIIWYKDLLGNGDLLEIDSPKEDSQIKIYGEKDGDQFEVNKNLNDKFEIGRTIYSNEVYEDIKIYCSILGERLNLFDIATKEHFIDNPMIYRNEKVIWDVENTFIGEKENVFFLILKGDNSYRIKIGNKNQELDGVKEDRYKVKVKIKDKNIFLDDNYKLIYEGEIIVGLNEKYRFKNTRINLVKVMGFHGFERNRTWLRLKPKYFVDNLELLQTDEGNYYSGKLCVIDKFGDIKVLDSMINEDGDFDRINPVRIEFRDNRTLWLSAGLQEKYPYIGDLFCDINRRGICNVAKEDSYFCQIKLYKYEEINV